MHVPSFVPRFSRALPRQVPQIKYPLCKKKKETLNPKPNLRAALLLIVCTGLVLDLQRSFPRVSGVYAKHYTTSWSNRHMSFTYMHVPQKYFLYW
jgi:hypothetical protein